MNCLVTGGSGFIGSHLCDLLVAEGHNVVVLDDLSTGNPINLNEAAKTEQLIFIQGGINEVERYANEIGHIDWIFHIAGRADLIPSIENPVDYFDVNTRGTLCMLEYAKRIGVKRFVYTASSTCYGIPDKYPTPETAACNVEHPYGLTKYLGEQLVIHWANVYQLPALSLRLFNVYGPRSRTSGVYGAVFGVFLKQKLEGKPYTVVGDGEQTRDFTYVGDVAKAFLAAAQSDKVGEIYNIGSGHTYSINKLVDLLGGEKTYIPRRPGEPNYTFADITKIQKEIGWKPAVTLEEGVQKMLDNIDFWRDAPLWTPESIQQATKTWFDCLNKYDTCK